MPDFCCDVDVISTFILCGAPQIVADVAVDGCVIDKFEPILEPLFPLLKSLQCTVRYM